MQAMHPQLTHQAGFAVGIGTLYGAFTGIFAARSLRLWKLALRPDADHLPAAISRQAIKEQAP